MRDDANATDTLQPMRPLTVVNARLLTLAGSAARRGAAMRSLGVIERGFVRCNAGRIESVGSGNPTGDLGEVIDAAGRVCMPALIDCHAHLCWGGNRWSEWENIRRGMPWSEILASGGGILNTVRATRATSEDELAQGVRGRLNAMQRLGIGTTEAKSGYGLNQETEARMLRAIGTAAQSVSIKVRRTFLGGHAIPQDDPEWPDRLAREVIPAFATLFPDAAVDAFCERNALSVDQARAVLQAAKAAGFACRLHTDQFNSLGGAEMAVQEGARTVDHLEAATDETVRCVGASPTIAVMVPCSGYALDGRYAPGRKLIDAGAAIALGSNCNPGSAPTIDLRFAMHLAVRHCGLSCEEAIVAATVNAAHALGIGGETGSLEPGRRADMIVLADRDERSIVHGFAHEPPLHVVLNGCRLSP